MWFILKIQGLPQQTRSPVALHGRVGHFD